MSENKKECELCGTLNPIDAVECNNCGERFLEIDEEEYAVLNALKQISGVGSSRAKNIVKAGYSEMDELGEIDIDNISAIKGIGESIASDIVETIEESKDKGGLYICDECGAFVGKEVENCSNCGSLMEEIDEGVENGSDDQEVVEGEGIEEKEESLYLCSNCGSFVGSKTSVCSNCGAEMEDIEDDSKETPSEKLEQHEDKTSEDLRSEVEDRYENDEEVEGEVEGEVDVDVDVEEEYNEEGDEEENGLFLCTNCGAFVSVSSTECPHCGYTLDEIEQEDMEHEIEERSEPDELETLEEESERLGSETSVVYEDESGKKGEEIESEEIKSEEIESEEIESEEIESEEIESEEIESEEIESEEIESGQIESEEIESEEIESGERYKEGIQEGFQIDNESLDSSRESKLVESETSVEGDIEETLGTDDEVPEEEMIVPSVGVVPIGDDVRVCSNCGWISDEDIDGCPMCESELTEEEIDTEHGASEKIETPKGSISDDVETFRRAFGLSEEESDTELMDDEDVHDREDKIGVCTVCGAFLPEDSERCSVCGSLSSETPDMESLEEVSDLDYTDGEISICDACGAFVDVDSSRCSICGSDMELARKDIEDEKVKLSDSDENETLEKFFGDDIVEETKGIVEEDDEIEIYLCNSCGAMVSAEAEICSICNSDLSDSEVESELEDEHLSRELKEIEEELELEEPGKEQDVGYVDEDIEAHETETDIELGEIEEEIDSAVSASTEAGSDTDMDEESSEFDAELNQEIESILKDITEEEEEKAEVQGVEKSKFEEEWTKCPVCNSHVSVESDYCSVCENPLDGKVESQDKETFIGTDPEPVTTGSTEEAKDEGPVVSKTKVSKSKPSIKSFKKHGSSQKTDYVTSHVEGKLKNVLYKAKDYEVPISSLSLLAFGGVYITTYRTSDFMYFAEIGLILIALFFGLGIITVYVFKDELLSHSLFGFMGYLLGIVISSFVPVGNYILGLEVPLIVTAGMIASALGLFWILENRLPEKFHHYMLWFSGISILFVVLLTIMVYPVQISLFEYPIVLPLGFGSSMVVGGTATWYRKANEIQEDIPIPSRSQGWKISSYKDSKGYFEDTSKTCPVSNEDAIPHYSKGIASCSIGEYDEAIKKFRKALELEGDNEAIWNNLGTAYSRIGDQDKARECLKQAIGENETYAIAWNNLGNANFRCGKYSEALDCYDKALEIEENYRDAMLNKSQVLIKLSKVEEG